jgi:hypothetical protein
MEQDIPTRYLTRLNALYEEWFADYRLSPVLVLGTDKNSADGGVYVFDLDGRVAIVTGAASVARYTACSGLYATPPRGMATPKPARSSLAWYSWMSTDQLPKFPSLLSRAERRIFP